MAPRARSLLRVMGGWRTPLAEGGQRRRDSGLQIDEPSLVPREHRSSRRGNNGERFAPAGLEGSCCHQKLQMSPFSPDDEVS